MKTALLILLLTALASAPLADARTTIGPAEKSCGSWTEETKENGVGITMYQSWVLGFLSGINSVSKKDFLKSTESAAIRGWMDKYCAENPLSTIYDAMMALLQELIAKAK